MQGEDMKRHFGQLAQRYDELRLPDEVVNPLVEKLVVAGDLHEKKVLDIGCGTGRTLSALVLRHKVQGWGIDTSAEMLEVAKNKVPSTITLREASAEALPFTDGFFERVYMTMVVHLLKRPLAFKEIWRVLQPGGRVTIMTADPVAFERSWLAGFFPSYVKVERNRFPSRETLEEELTTAGFIPASCLPHQLSRPLSKADALRKLRERHISTFALFDDEEYQSGVAQAERDLPELITSVQESLLISAVKPG